jgi:hypothetical protein
VGALRPASGGDEDGFGLGLLATVHHYPPVCAAAKSMHCGMLTCLAYTHALVVQEPYMAVQDAWASVCSIIGCKGVSAMLRGFMIWGGAPQVRCRCFMPICHHN